MILYLVEVRRRLGIIPDSSPTVIEKKNCLYIYSVQKMILKFDLKLVVVDLHVPLLNVE